MTVNLVYERAIRNYAEQQKVKVGDSSWSLKHHDSYLTYLYGGNNYLVQVFFKVVFTVARNFIILLHRVALIATSLISRLSLFASGTSLVASVLILRSLWLYLLEHYLVWTALSLSSFVLVGVKYDLFLVSDNVGTTTRRLVS